MSHAHICVLCDVCSAGRMEIDLGFRTYSTFTARDGLAEETRALKPVQANTRNCNSI